MNDKSLIDPTLRQFLLGNIDDEQRQSIESLFITNSSFKERVLVLEQDLIEDYLEDSLAANDKNRFLTRYSETPALRRKLRIAKAIKAWAVREEKRARNSSVYLWFWGRLRAYLRRRQLLVIPIAATSMITLVLGISWLNSRVQPQTTSSCRDNTFTVQNYRP